MSILSFIAKRLMILPVVLILAHFISYSYANLSLSVQRAQNPWGSSGEFNLNLWSNYYAFLQNVEHNGLGFMPGGTALIFDSLQQAAQNSLGLFLLAFLISAGLGIVFGLLSINTEPIAIKKWLPPIAALGLATPGFFVATLFFAATVYYLLSAGSQAVPPLPVSGMGWDQHLIMPTLALLIRPTAQIAQATATLLSQELSKQYVVAARSIGNTWLSIRKKHALKNIMHGVFATLSGSFRYMMAELILVEWIFNWHGLGRLLALTLIPPTTSSVSGFGNAVIFFMHPELLSAVITSFVLIFFFMDTLFTSLTLWVDPRIRSREVATFYG